MKKLILFLVTTTVITSCLLKERNSFLYKTAIKISKQKGIYEVSIKNQNELKPFKYKAQVNVLDENGESGSIELFERDISIYQIEKAKLEPCLFTRDLCFTNIYKNYKIDSISFWITFIDSTHKGLQNPSRSYSTSFNNQPNITWKKNLIDDIIIYSGKREYYFINPFLWVETN